VPRSSFHLSSYLCDTSICAAIEFCEPEEFCSARPGWLATLTGVVAISRKDEIKHWWLGSNGDFQKRDLWK
jgi:hypothetical protein